MYFQIPTNFLHYVSLEVGTVEVITLELYCKTLIVTLVKKIFIFNNSIQNDEHVHTLFLGQNSAITSLENSMSVSNKEWNKQRKNQGWFTFSKYCY